MSHSRILLASASAVGILAGSDVAWAATATPSTDQGAGVAVAEVVVTARRRDERLVDVPAAASVIDAQLLSDRGGATSTAELLAGQPSVRFFNTTSPVNSEVSIRGSATARATNADPSVGLYRDGVYVGGGLLGGRSFTRLDLFDVGRVEVLRGTQGALYGRNAVGGAVNIVSAQPVFADTGYVDVKYGVENRNAQVQAVANVALSDKVAARFGVDYTDQDKGFFYNPYNHVYFDDQQGYGARAQLRLHDGPVDATVLYEHQQMRLPAIAYEVYILPSARFPKGYIQPEREYPWNAGPFSKQQLNNLTATLAYDMGWARLVSTSAVRERKTSYLVDLDGVNPDLALTLIRSGTVVGALDPNASSNVNDRTRSISQDVHLAGAALDSRLDWLAGAELLWQRSNGYSVTRTSLTAAGSPLVVDYRSYAAYGSLGFQLTPHLTVTGEGRYTSDHKTADASRYNLLTGALAGGPAFNFNASQSPDNFSYNLTAAWRFQPQLQLYAKAGSSYRAGGFNSNLGDPRQPVTVPASYDQEDTTSYEVGLKGVVLRSVYVALAGYRNESSNLIVQTDNGCRATNPVCPVVPTTFLTNAGDGVTWGVELEASGRFALGPGVLRSQIGGSRQGGEVKSGALKGYSLPQIPAWIASASLDYRFPVQQAQLFAHADYSAQWGGVQELARPSPAVDDFQLVNLRVGAEFKNVELSFYVNNATDVTYFTYQDLTTTRRLNQPRLWGAQARYRW